jgi:uncharacterized protein with von Willebrand factor type A (vWA) domain
MQIHGNGFDPYALDAPLAPLEDLPRELWLQSIINSLGELLSRLKQMPELRDALVRGEAPCVDGLAWPPPPAAAAFLAKIASLGLPRYCEHHEDVAGQVLRAMLWHSDRIIDYQDEYGREAAIQRAAQAFHDEWQEMSGEIEALLFVFDDLGDALKFNRWDLTRGLLRSEGWQELVRIRKLLEHLPEVRAVIRRLGRAQQTEEPDPANLPQVQVMEKTRTLAPRLREIHVPELPAETRGIHRSGSIARMLPSEAVHMRHPRLRLAWFARHAEHALLTYEDDDTLTEPVLVEAESWRPNPHPIPERRLEMGPMIVCVDTSGSMQGGAEQVAKAAVLEAMRVANAQRRRCYVYAFGGPEEILELELPVDAQGIEAVITFLTQSFKGGTEVSEPLRRAVERLSAEEWRFADLLLATDGEFGAPPEIAGLVAKARDELGLRVQGILIGDRETIGMLELCNDIFWVKDWRRFGAGGEVPIHSKSLTAQYFPGALRHVNENRPTGEAVASLFAKPK